MSMVLRCGAARRMALTWDSSAGPGSMTVESPRMYVLVPSSVSGPGFGAVMLRIFTAVGSSYGCLRSPEQVEPAQSSRQDEIGEARHDFETPRSPEGFSRSEIPWGSRRHFSQAQPT